MSSSESMDTPPSSNGTTPFLRAPIDPTKTENGIRTILELIDFNACENANHLFCVQALKDGGSIGISHRQLKQAIHSCRNHLIATMSKLQVPEDDSQGKVVKPPPVALLGESNVVLLIHLLALVSIGVPVCSFPNLLRTVQVINVILAGSSTFCAP